MLKSCLQFTNCGALWDVFYILKMLTFEFESLSDVFIEHYVISLVISFVFIITTFVISKRFGIQVKMTESDPSFCCRKRSFEQEKESMDVTCLKKSPALVAEKVIKANMTEEQKMHEHEVRQKQLAQIYELMQKQSDKFGNISLSEVEEQFKLYQ